MTIASERDPSDPPGRTWLFDMNADPTEQRDLSAERPEKLAELSAAPVELMLQDQPGQETP